MIGIKAIGSYVPKDFIDNVEQAKKFGETDAFVSKKIGALRLPRKSSSQDSSDLAKEAVLNLIEKCPALKKSDIDALVVVTQNPDAEGLPHTSAILHKKLDLPNTVAAFDISLGCSGFVYGLGVLKGFLETSGLQNGILVTSDQYSKIINSNDRVTSMLFGDAATATLIGEDPILSLDEIKYGTNSEGKEFLQISDGQLHMNGRQIFNFAATQVEPHIKAVLSKQNLLPEDIDLYCLHQGSGAIVDSIAKRFNTVSDRFVKDMSDTGNTISSSIPLLLEKVILNSDTNRILISGFGVGLSIATAIISKVNKG